MIERMDVIVVWSRSCVQHVQQGTVVLRWKVLYFYEHLDIGAERRQCIGQQGDGLTIRKLVGP
jgi:hypothetical protein